MINRFGIEKISIHRSEGANLWHCQIFYLVSGRGSSLQAFSKERMHSEQYLSSSCASPRLQQTQPFFAPKKIALEKDLEASSNLSRAYSLNPFHSINQDERQSSLSPRRAKARYESPISQSKAASSARVSSFFQMLLINGQISSFCLSLQCVLRSPYLQLLNVCSIQRHSSKFVKGQLEHTQIKDSYSIAFISLYGFTIVFSRFFQMLFFAILTQNKMSVSESVQSLSRWQIYDTFFEIFQGIFDFSKFFVAETNVIVAKAEAIRFIHLMELVIGLFEGVDSFLELDVVHEEIAEKMMKIRMHSTTLLNNFRKIVQTFVVLVLRFKYSGHKEVFENEFIWVVHCEMSLQGSQTSFCFVVVKSKNGFSEVIRPGQFMNFIGVYSLNVLGNFGDSKKQIFVVCEGISKEQTIFSSESQFKVSIQQQHSEVSVS